MCTARKTNRRSLEVYFDDRCQFSVVKFRSDSVQVCDLGSSKKGRSLKKKIQSRWEEGIVKGEGSRCLLSVTAPWLGFFGVFHQQGKYTSVCACVYLPDVTAEPYHQYLYYRVSSRTTVTKTKNTNSHLYSSRYQNLLESLSTSVNILNWSVSALINRSRDMIKHRTGLWELYKHIYTGDSITVKLSLLEEPKCCRCLYLVYCTAGYFVRCNAKDLLWNCIIHLE